MTIKVTARAFDDTKFDKIETIYMIGDIDINKYYIKGKIINQEIYNDFHKKLEQDLMKQTGIYYRITKISEVTQVELENESMNDLNKSNFRRVSDIGNGKNLKQIFKK